MQETLYCICVQHLPESCFICLFIFCAHNLLGIVLGGNFSLGGNSKSNIVFSFLFMHGVGVEEGVQEGVGGGEGGGGWSGWPVRSGAPS